MSMCGFVNKLIDSVWPIIQGLAIPDGVNRPMRSLNPGLGGARRISTDKRAIREDAVAQAHLVSMLPTGERRQMARSGTERRPTLTGE